jgi:hypothetical protein
MDYSYGSVGLAFGLASKQHLRSSILGAASSDARDLAPAQSKPSLSLLVGIPPSLLRSGTPDLTAPLLLSIQPAERLNNTFPPSSSSSSSTSDDDPLRSSSTACLLLRRRFSPYPLSFTPWYSTSSSLSSVLRLDSSLSRGREGRAAAREATLPVLSVGSIQIRSSGAFVLRELLAIILRVTTVIDLRRKDVLSIERGTGLLCVRT